MEPDPLSNLQTVVDRFTQGMATENDFAFLRRTLIISGNQNVVQIGKYNINISQGIDNPTLQEAIRKVLHSIDSNRYDQSLRDYFQALRVYSAKFPYLTLTNLVAGEQKDLSQVYVPLRMRRDMAGTYDNEQVLINTVLQQISHTPKTPHLLLLGAPGAGKSTLLRQVARCAWETATAVGLDKSYLPMVVRLQSLSLVEGVSVEEKLINALRKDSELILEQLPPPGFFEAWSSSMETGWLLLLDGLDEVSNRMRPAVLSWLDSLLKFVEAKDHHIILTSRPMGEVPAVFKGKFITCELLPFTQKQQSSLAQQWLGEQSHKFLQQMAQVRADALTQTPLLLTIAASVYKRNGYLAEQRADLYEQFIDVLLTEADMRGMREELGAGTDSVREGLGYLALAMTKNPEKTSLTELSNMISQYVSQIFPDVKPTPVGFSKKFIEVVSLRSGIFIRLGDNYTWIHPTFREFFTAKALLSTQLKHWYRIAKKYWKKEEWQETIFFFLALLSNEEVNVVRFAERLLKKRTWIRTISTVVVWSWSILVFFLCIASTFPFLQNIQIVSQNAGFLGWMVAISFVGYLIWFWRKSGDDDFIAKKDSLFFLVRLVSSCKLDWEFKKNVVRRLLTETLKTPKEPLKPKANTGSVARAYELNMAAYRKATRKREAAQKILADIDDRLLVEIYKDLLNDKDQEIRSEAQRKL